MDSNIQTANGRNISSGVYSTYAVQYLVFSSFVLPAGTAMLLNITLSQFHSIEHKYSIQYKCQQGKYHCSVS